VSDPAGCARSGCPACGGLAATATRFEPFPRHLARDRSQRGGARRAGQNLDLICRGVPQLTSITGRDVDRDGEIARKFLFQFRKCGKRKNVGRFVLVTKPGIQGTQFIAAGKQYIHCARKSSLVPSTPYKARKRCIAKPGNTFSRNDQSSSVRNTDRKPSDGSAISLLLTLQREETLPAARRPSFHCRAPWTRATRVGLPRCGSCVRRMHE